MQKEETMRLQRTQANQSVTARRRSVACIAMTMASALFANSGVSASTTRTWNTTNGNWSVAGNWTPGSGPVAVPGAGDTVNITNTDGLNRIITYDYTGTAVTLNSLTLSLTGNPANADTLSMAANSLSATDEYLGFSGGTGGVGVINQSGGTNTVGSLELAVNPADSGYYYLSGTASLSVGGTEWVSYEGNAIFNQSGGSNVVSGSEAIGTGAVGTFGTYLQSAGTNQTGQLIIGYGAAGSSGTFNLSGGGLTSTSRALLGNSSGSTGNFIQTGGTFSTPAGITIGGSGSGTYNLNGSITASLTTAGSILIGTSATGLFVQSDYNGNVSAGSLSVGSGANGTYNLSDGNLTVSGVEVVGIAGTGVGTFLQFFGTNAVTGDLDIGQNSLGSFYNLSNGTLTVGGNLNLGNNGTGTLNLNTSGQTIAVTGALNVGVGAGSIGHLNINSIYGSSNLSAGSINIGGNAIAAGGAAVVNIGPGSLLSTAGTLTLYNTSGVSLNLSGGTLVAGQIVFGGTTSRLNWTSGTFNISAGIFAVDNSTLSGSIGPSFTLGSGKTLISDFGEGIGYAGNGTFLQTGGANIADELVIGGFTGSDNGTYTLAGGNLNVSTGVQPLVAVGYLGTGQFNQTGGMSTIALLAAGLLPGEPGTINVSGNASMLVTREIDLGVEAPGLFNQSGGRVVVGTTTLAANMSIGAAVSTTGSYLLNGGTLGVNGNVAVGGYLAGTTALTPGPEGLGVFTIGPAGAATITGTLQIYPNTGSTVILSGGSLTTGVLDTLGTPANFNWSSGTVTLTNTYLAFDSQATTANDPFGSVFNLSSGQTLVVSENESIGGVGTGSLTISTGAVNTVIGTLTVNAGGTLTLAGGTLQVDQSITLSGGTIVGTLVNTSAFDYLSGTFSGRLVNQGTVNLSANFTAPGGIENDAYFEINAGQTLTTGSTGLDNLGTIYMNGGVLAGSPVLNDYGGLLQGYGTIQPAFTNDGTVYVNGPLTLNTASANYGTITVSAGAVIRGSTLTNNGSITLSGGAITAPLSNPAGGTVGGYGSVAGGLTSSGEVQPGNGTLTITTAWTNAGLISFQSGPGVLAGATLTNTGTIEGVGEVTATVLNTTGIIRAQGGELDLAGIGCTIGATAQIQAKTGSTVLFVQGLAVNAGTIALSGGTFDNNSQPLTNNNMIEGTGTFDAGSWNSTSGAQINLIANASFFGPLTNAGAMHLYGTGIIFYGNVVNTGTVKVTGGSVFFLGANGATIGGAYTSDPSDNFFNILSTTPTGIVSGGAGDRFFLLNGSAFTNAGAFNDLGTLSANAVSSSGAFLQTGTLVETGNFTNSGTATIGGTQNWSHGTVFTNTAGSATFQSDAGVTGENLSVNVSGGSVTFASTQHLAAINISVGGTVQISGGGSGHRSVVFTPTFANTGTLDITANDVDLQGGGPAGLTTLTAQIKNGYKSGTWTGVGITSSTATADPTHLTAVGVIVNNIGGSTPLYTSLDGAPVAVNDVLVKDTYYGDTNLDGKVDGSDYSRIDAAYLADRSNPTALTGWFNGDFNYDGVVDGSDYTLIDNAFNTQGAQLSAALATATAQIAGTSAVPEPAAMSLLAITAIGILGRRRVSSG